MNNTTNSTPIMSNFYNADGAGWVLLSGARPISDTPSRNFQYSTNPFETELQRTLGSNLNMNGLPSMYAAGSYFPKDFHAQLGQMSNIARGAGRVVDPYVRALPLPPLVTEKPPESAGTQFIRTMQQQNFGDVGNAIVSGTGAVMQRYPQIEKKATPVFETVLHTVDSVAKAAGPVLEGITKFFGTGGAGEGIGNKITGFLGNLFS